MKELVFATQNKHKLEEIQQAINGHFDILSLFDLNYLEEIPETGETLVENALQKANFIYQKYGKDCFADDTGLEIESLNGQPGVYSARYAGNGRSFEDNMNKVLENLHGKTNRKACFKTVIALIYKGENYFFEGVVNGVITTEKKGKEGFGYDPIFLPDGYSKTFAELSLEEKNKMSHRALASQKLIHFLRQNK
ncbi:MAG: non-canonical purine NTP diphosphatase [Bacteroidales bacterium]|nr:non-canonical purine NTP diphosphatase [Bacteroidales bacterium]MDY0217084.1 non-canonical purine NTP diphosphatase [Bacteroidales bacterium]